MFSRGSLRFHMLVGFILGMLYQKVNILRPHMLAFRYHQLRLRHDDAS
jgi:hypothetical protein